MSNTIIVNMTCEVSDPWSLGKTEEEIDSKIKSILSESYGTGKMNTKKKGSETFMDNYTLTCKTNPIELNEENVDKIMESFKEMKKYNFTTNDDSKLEIVIEDKNETSDRDILWAYCNLAVSDDVVESVKKVYPKEKRLAELLETTHNLIKENDFVKLSKFIKENKEEILKLEKRDKMVISFPCNFLEEQFLNKLDAILKCSCQAENIIEEASQSKEIIGISKESFFEIASL